MLETAAVEPSEKSAPAKSVIALKASDPEPGR
jgi:hypothetical protein